MLVQLGNGFISQLRRGAGRDGNFQIETARVIDQLIDVLAPQRISAGENQVRQRITKLEELANESLAFLGCQFEWMRTWHGFSPAMLAGQAASLGHLPVNEHWIV